MFVDTTSLSFYGKGGGRSAGSHSRISTRSRPDDLACRRYRWCPICTEPGNTADVTVLVLVVDRLRARFGITRACFVADRGMISADTIAALEERGMDYILGARERSSSVVRDIVLNDDVPLVPLALDRQHGETQLWVKEVRVGQQRYIVSLNEAEAKKERADRQAVIAGLETQLRKGDKALIGNSAYRRYLRKAGKDKSFEIDAGKLAEEARFDGISVLRTNTRSAVAGRDPPMRPASGGSAVRAAKASFDTRPIYRSRMPPSAATSSAPSLRRHSPRS